MTASADAKKDGPDQGQPSIVDAVHRCRAYGCSITSAFPLPELMLDDGPYTHGPDGADLLIRPVHLEGMLPSGPDGRLIDLAADRSFLAWSGFGRVIIESNRHILVDLLPDFDPAMLGFILLGPVLSPILNGRGMSVLHGSCVAAPDRPDEAIILLGDSGAGKSTLAAACIAAGFDLVNDDITAIGTAEDISHFVQPGFPSLKLSRAALRLLDPLPGHLLPEGVQGAAKLRLRLRDHDPARRRIRHICVIRRGERAELHPFTPAQGLQALMRYSYLPKLGPTALTGAMAAHHFARCAAIADTTPIATLTVPSSLEELVDTPRQLANLLA